jgi:DNA ligase-1
MLLSELVAASRDVAATRSRRSKIERLAKALRALQGEEVALGIAYLHGVLPQGRIGIGPALVRESLFHADSQPGGADLTLVAVDRVLSRLAAISGVGSAAQRRQVLVALFGGASEVERDFLVRLLLGELRQGALEGMLVEGMAAAWELPISALRRAVMLAGEPSKVAAAVVERGPSALNEFGLRLMQPLKPMLAQSAEDPAAALAALGEAALEYKLDGARVQVHKLDGEVRVFSRQLNDVTASVPEVVEQVAALPARSLLLDGETLALRPDGRALPFQITMRRFGRRLGVDAARADLPLSVYFFDCLYANGEELLGLEGAERAAWLGDMVPEPLRVPRTVTADPGVAEGFLRAALGAGHEGIMAKSLEAPYEAGSRGAGWLKLKPAHSVDLVVLGAEWGSGRRRGWLSNLHLGARNPLGGFVMVGKTFKGLTDSLLRWQTEALLARELGREGVVVHVRPELVVEIAFNELQVSPHYPGGLALRFARVRRYRPDKSAAEADSIEALRAIHRAQCGLS